jgi:acetyl esterase
MRRFSDLLVEIVTRRIVETRTDIDTVSLKRRFPRLGPVGITDVTIAGPNGPVPARRYRAPGSTRAGLVWMHGGAFVAGDLDMPEANWVSLELAARGIPVLSVDYRKARRGVRFPVPVDDVAAAWEAAVRHAEDWFGVDAADLHLGGASAGATLAAGLAVRLRDRSAILPTWQELVPDGGGAAAPRMPNGGRMPASLVLAYPMLHPYLPSPSDEAIAATAKLRGVLRFRPWVVRTLGRHYAGHGGMTDPHAFAGLAGSLAGLPPVYVLIAAIDDLRPSGELFAQQLRDAGGDVELVAERSATHGHLNHPEAASAQRSVARIADWILRQR